MGRNRHGDSPHKYHQKKRKDERKRAKLTKGDVLRQSDVRGRVKRFFGDHGFIVREDGGGEVFLHISDLFSSGRRNIDPGQSVIFDVTERSGRLCATTIRVCD